MLVLQSKQSYASVQFKEGLATENSLYIFFIMPAFILKKVMEQKTLSISLHRWSTKVCGTVPQRRP